MLTRIKRDIMRRPHQGILVNQTEITATNIPRNNVIFAWVEAYRAKPPKYPITTNPHKSDWFLGLGCSILSLLNFGFSPAVVNGILLGTEPAFP